MHNSLITSIGLTKELIVRLKLLLQKAADSQKEFELGFIQQFLDEESLYIKQIPSVRIIINYRTLIIYSEPFLIHYTEVKPIFEPYLMTILSISTRIKK